MKETEQTLFLKSNILHIRTNEGEFEVSNPEIIGDPETIKIIFNDGKPFGGMPIEPVWPGGVELIVSTEGVSTKAVARLLPKEEKKEPFVKALDDIQKIENLSVNNSAHSFTESTYKDSEFRLKIKEEVCEKLRAENKALREEINALNGDIQSYRNGHEVNAKRYNDLLIERNKLGEEVERLKAEVLKEKFPEN